MCLYYITFSDAETAEAVGRALLEQRLAVCVNWFPITCAYLWEGEIVQEPETVLIVKAPPNQLKAIEAVVQSHVDYVNFIGEITLSCVNRGFLEWLSRETGRHLEKD